MNNNNDIMELDFHDVIHDIDRSLAYLGWSKEQGKEYIKAKYGKNSRLRLTDPELLEFRDYLKHLVLTTDKHEPIKTEKYDWKTRRRRRF